jgi:hypothetical protein
MRHHGCSTRQRDVRPSRPAVRTAARLRGFRPRR